MEAPQQQRQLSVGPSGDNEMMSGMTPYPDTPKSSGRPPRSTCPRCANSRSKEDAGDINGVNSSGFADPSVTNRSWADQIQDAHYALRLDMLQEMYTSAQDGFLVSNQPAKSRCMEATTLHLVGLPAVGNATLDANGRQPEEVWTTSAGESNGEGPTSEEVQRTRSMCIYAAGVFVIVVCAVVLWKGRFAILSLTHKCDQELEPEQGELTRWARWEEEFQELLDGPWI